MTDQLVAYLLDDLSDEQRLEIERLLAESPDARDELARLAKCLRAGGSPCSCLDAFDAVPGDDDQFDDFDEAPPEDLADRTCQALTAFTNRAAAMPAVAGAMQGVDLLADSSRPRWNGADVLLTSGAVLLVAALAMPKLSEVREHARRTTCEDNLRYLATAASDYFDRFRRPPQMGLAHHAGIFTLRLIEEGGEPRDYMQQRLFCPSGDMMNYVSSHGMQVWVPTRQELLAATERQQAEWLRTMLGDYAVRVGVLDAWGAYRELPFRGTRYEPLLADAPSMTAPGVRSVNHGGGQYVVFQDCSLKFCIDCSLPFAPGQVEVDVHDPDLPAALPCRDDHVFLNRQRKAAVGLGMDDVVMLRSEYTPLGLLEGMHWLRAALSR